MPEETNTKPDTDAKARPAGEAPKSGPDAAEADAYGIETPDDAVAALAAEVADLRDRLLRAAAEMENTRKRAEREAADGKTYAVTAFARDLLPVADNLRRALDAAPAGARDAGSATATVLDGIDVTERELLRVLERHGVTRVAAAGEKFDPHRHQAIYEVEKAGVVPGTVADVVQQGYVIRDRVLRPALVTIAKAPKPQPAAAPTAPAPAATASVEDDANSE